MSGEIRVTVERAPNEAGFYAESEPGYQRGVVWRLSFGSSVRYGGPKREQVLARCVEAASRALGDKLSELVGWILIKADSTRLSNRVAGRSGAWACFPSEIRELVMSDVRCTRGDGERQRCAAIGSVGPVHPDWLKRVLVTLLHEDRAAVIALPERHVIDEDYLAGLCSKAYQGSGKVAWNALAAIIADQGGLVFRSWGRFDDPEAGVDTLSTESVLTSYCPGAGARGAP